MSYSKRVELYDDAMDQVSGGALRWTSAGTMTSTDEDIGGTYTFDVSNFDNIRTFMYTNCQGFTDAETVNALLGAGMISHA